MMPEYRAMANEAGRDIPVTVFGGEPVPDMLKRYEDAGIERVVINLDPMDRDSSLTKLDAWVKAGVLRAT